MKLIMTYMYIRSTMTKSRLMNLAILSTERETIELVDFTEVIENFAYAVHVICYLYIIDCCVHVLSVSVCLLVLFNKPESAESFDLVV